MPNTTKKYPAVLYVGISKEMQTDLANMAAKRNVPVAELVRVLLTESLSQESASNGQVAVRQAVRTEIRQELKRVENRLAMLGAKSSIAAATAENMLVALFERSIPGEAAERQAKTIHEEARKKAVSSLKQPGDGEGEDA